jgi:radical SAM/Cys-rich protein
MLSFKDMLKKHGLKIVRGDIKTVQINVGKRCNQRCTHCHVNAGPEHTENMDEKTANRIFSLLENTPQIETIDITGGAPELNSNFRKMVETSRKMGKKVIARTNLTVFFEPGQEDTPAFLARNNVLIFASLPCYTKENVDKQRGEGTFKKSIQALKILNQLGYGKKNTNLILSLIYNPLGPYLPSSQTELENDYKARLKEDFDIEFNQLFTITNMPIGRFYECLEKANSLNQYLQLLIDHFNPETVPHVMCTETISISWDGYIHACDFNQALEMPINDKWTSLWDIDRLDQLNKTIILDDHCYGCTAGSGSSCQGTLNREDTK